jgi:hypothetical protein
MAARFWVGGTGTWSSSNTTNWSATTGGAGGASVPTTADTVAINTLSGTGTVTTDTTTPNCGAITASSGGIIVLQLGAALTSTGVFTLSSGTLDLQSYTLTCTTFNSSFSNARTIAFGTGNIIVTSTGTVWTTATFTSLTVTGTPVVNVVYTGLTSITASTGLSANSAVAISFNFTGGTYQLFIASSNYLNLNFTGYAGLVLNSNRRIYGNLTCSTGMTWESGNNTTTFAATTGTKTITANTRTLNFPITFGISSGTATWVLQDDLTVGSTKTTALVLGTLDLNDKNFSTGSFVSGGTSSRTLLMKSGTLSLTGTGTVWTISPSLTLTSGTSKIALTDTSSTARTFSGVANVRTYYDLEIGGATGISTLTFIGNNTFNTISSTKTVAHTILFTAATTTTVANWTVTGTAGNIVTIGSVTAAGHNLVKTGGGNISVDYMSISRSNASP